MSLNIACSDMGFEGKHSISGGSTEELLRQMQEHAIAKHGYSDVELQEPEMIEFMLGAIRQSARPENLRSPRES